MGNMKCWVPQCSSRYKRGLPADQMHLKISFHPIPNNKTTVRIERGLGIIQKLGRRDAWLLKTQIRTPIFNSTTVCSLHFQKDDYFKTTQRAVLKKNAVPSLNLPSSTNTVEKLNNMVNNYNIGITDAERIQVCSCVSDNCAKTAYSPIYSCCGCGVNNLDDPLNIEDTVVKKEIPDLEDCKDPLFIPADTVVKMESPIDSHEASVSLQEIKYEEVDEWTMQTDYVHIKSEEHSQVGHS